MRINTEQSMREPSIDARSNSEFGYQKNYKLSNCLHEFNIERDDLTYKVEVFKRLSVEGHPVQI